MMALAALSMAGSDSKARLVALQQYQQALPALQATLKSTDDLSSDGAFLTHFLLLVYEVSGSNRFTTSANEFRSPQPKQARTIFGHSTFLHCSESHFCDARSLVAKDTPSSFGGSALSILMLCLLAQAQANTLVQC